MKKNKSEKFDFNGNVIYNGKYAGTVAYFDEGKLMPVTGEVKIADTDFNGLYDVIFVWNYDVYVVEQTADTRVLLKNDRGAIDANPGTNGVSGPMDIYDADETMALNGVIVRYTGNDSAVENRGDERIS